MSEEMTDIWDAMKDIRREDRAKAKIINTEFLEKKGVQFAAYNGGHHLIISHASRVIDFWPASGKWIVRNQKIGTKGRRGFDVASLMKVLDVK